MVIKPSGPKPVKMKLYSLVTLAILLTGSNAVENGKFLTYKISTAIFIFLEP